MNSMMNCYFINKMDSECIGIFNDIPTPNVLSFVIALKSCTQSLLYHDAQSIHSKLREDSNRGILMDLAVQIELVNMYGKAGRMDVVEQIMSDLKTANGAMFDLQKTCLV